MEPVPVAIVNGKMEETFKLRYADEDCDCGGFIRRLYPINLKPRIWRGLCRKCGEKYDVFIRWSDNK